MRGLSSERNDQEYYGSDGHRSERDEHPVKQLTEDFPQPILVEAEEGEKRRGEDDESNSYDDRIAPFREVEDDEEADQRIHYEPPANAHPVVLQRLHLLLTFSGDGEILVYEVERDDVDKTRNAPCNDLDVHAALPNQNYCTKLIICQCTQLVLKCIVF